MEHNNTPPAEGASVTTGWDQLAQYAPTPRTAVERGAEQIHDQIVDALDKNALNSATENYEGAAARNEQAQTENAAKIDAYDEQQLQSQANQYIRESERAETVMEREQSRSFAEYNREAKAVREAYDKKNGQINREEQGVNREMEQLRNEHEEQEARRQEIDTELDGLHEEAQEILSEIKAMQSEVTDVESLRADLSEAKTRLERARSRGMKKMGKNKVRALERQIAEAEADEKIIASADAELVKVERQIKRLEQQRQLVKSEMRAGQARTDVLVQRVAELDARRTEAREDYNLASQEALDRLDARREETVAKRESVKERYSDEVRALGSELVGGSDNAGELTVRSRIDRAKEAVGDALAGFAAGASMNFASRRAASAEAKLLAREAVLTDRREKSEATQAELEKRAQGRELEVEQIRADAEARRDQRETRQDLQKLNGLVTQRRDMIEKAYMQDQYEAEQDESEAAIDEAQLETYYPAEEKRVADELAENAEYAQEIESSMDSAAAAQKVEDLKAKLASAKTAFFKKSLQKKLRLAEQEFKGIQSEEAARQRELAMIEKENEALRAEQEQLAAEKQQLAEAEAARAERAAAREEREQQLREAADGLERAYKAEHQKLVSGYEGRKQAREEKLKQLLENYRPEVMAMGSAVVEEEQATVVAAKKSFFKKLQQAAAAVFFSL
jgi:chromosome segregation ATPase